MTVRARKPLAPGCRIRVLVVDDSVVIRRLVTHALEEDALIEVVGARTRSRWMWRCRRWTAWRRCGASAGSIRNSA